MKNTFTHLLSLGVICLISIGCQTSAPDRKLSTSKPTKAKPFPAWTQQSSKAQGSQQIKIAMKLVEVTRPLGSSEIPTKRYERKLDASQFQVFMRGLAQKKGTDVMTAPSVLTRDGEKATVEVIREFAYPVESGKDAKKEVENTGVTSHIKAVHLGSRNISLKTFTRISEFDGFFEAKPEFDLPVFDRRDVEISSRLKSGETIVVGGILDEASQEIVDAGPLGIIKKRSTHEFSRELIIAVTATLIKPDGSTVGAR